WPCAPAGSGQLRGGPARRWGSRIWCARYAVTRSVASHRWASTPNGATPTARRSVGTRTRSRPHRDEGGRPAGEGRRVGEVIAAGAGGSPHEIRPPYRTPACRYGVASILSPGSPWSAGVWRALHTLRRGKGEASRIRSHESVERCGS